jgi:hypothetical protein
VNLRSGCRNQGGEDETKGAEMKREAHWALTLWVLTAVLGCAPGRGEAAGHGQELAALDGSEPLVGPEFGLGQSIQGRPALNEAGQVIATNANGVSLAVWTINFDQYTDIYGARIGPDGTVLDPTGIPIATGPTQQATPAVTSDGTGWFVVWADALTTVLGAVRGTRITSNGTVLDPEGIAITNSNAWTAPLSVASDGHDFLVAWVGPIGFDGTSSFATTRVSADGTVLDTEGVVFATIKPLGFNLRYGPSLAFDGTDYIAVYNNERSFNEQ